MVKGYQTKLVNAHGRSRGRHLQSQGGEIFKV